MASIKERNHKFYVICRYKDENGKDRQKWEPFPTKAEAKKRKKEVEYKQEQRTFFIPQCKLLKDLLSEYVELYGKDTWALSTYDGNLSLIDHYILPIIGDTELTEINTYFLEKYYKQLLRTAAVRNTAFGKPKNKYVSTSTIRDIHKILRSCFKQAVKWKLMEHNPATNATVPKYKQEERAIWTPEILKHALSVCEDELLKNAMSLTFSGSLRIGELLALTWDCVDISKEAIAEDRPFIYINKELQRVSKKAMAELDQKDILLVFPEKNKLCKTVLVLKTPKTQSSIRKVYIPASVAEMLAKRKAEQEELKDVLADEYRDYNLVFATSFGTPIGNSRIRKAFKKLIREHDLPPVVFHSLRHSSITYKLKLNGGDIKSVQGDSGHAQAKMVTDVYSRILDEDRMKNARLLEESFYGQKHPDSQAQDARTAKTITLPEGVDAEALAKVLANPEMTALLISMAKSIQA